VKEHGMSLIKALIPSTILTLIVSAIVGSTGTTGSFLRLDAMTISGHTFYWSWPFFVIVMALNCILITQVSKEVST
jgi:hypothetical protein